MVGDWPGWVGRAWWGDLTGLPVPSRELCPDIRAKAWVFGFLKLEGTA